MQERIIKLLIKKKKPMGRVEIAKHLNSTPIKISMALRQLVKFEEVQCVEINHDQAWELFGSKRRMRLYYCEESD